ncbi:MAG TPA: hypothetical protein VN903_30470 [Polyangia bacterium]|nr:hypothetical protein [Polyangia bacterium]
MRAVDMHGHPIRLFGADGRLRFGGPGDGDIVQPGDPPPVPAGAAGPSLYYPPAWDLVNNRYYVQKDDVPYLLAQFTGMDKDPGNKFPVSSLAKINPGLIMSNGMTNPAVWRLNAAINISQAASDKIAALECPPGYEKASDGRNCQVKPGVQGTPPGAPPVQGKPPWSTGKKIAVFGGAIVGTGVLVVVGHRMVAGKWSF